MYALPRGGGLSAQGSLPTDRTKNPSTHPRRRRVDWARYRYFLRNGWTDVLRSLADHVRRLPPPFPVRPPGTPGRPPTNPRDVVRFLLLRSLEGWSYDETHATLIALPQLARQLGFRRIPAAPTVAALVARIPTTYLERLISGLAQELCLPHENLAGDGTGISTRRYEHWMAAHVTSEHRHVFIKLHALVATRAQFPFFLAAHVTSAYVNDVTELPTLLRQIPPNLSIGNVVLDRGYVRRINAQAIADRGGRPVIALRSSIRRVTRAEGCPAWKRMVVDQFAHQREFRCRYRRRAVIEGVFGAFKQRFGPAIRSKRPHARAIEVLARVAVWNTVAGCYHRS